MIGHDPTRTYTAVILGAGAAGLTLAVGLAGFGHDVVLVERDAVGGDCTTVGCIPSKALLHAAAQADPDALARTRAIRDALAASEDAEIAADEHIHLVRGSARLTRRRDPHVVTVTTGDGATCEVRARHVVVCTGSGPVDVAVDGLPVGRASTNEQLFGLDHVPSRLVVVGGGAVAVEMATAFADLGTAVHLVEATERILGAFDPVVSETVAAAFARRGIDVRTGVTVDRWDETTRTAQLSDGSTVADVDHVLVAAGRRPRTAGLDLDVAGVDHTPSGITVDEWGRTGVDGIWAVGDVTGRTATTHGANALGRRVVRAIALPALPRRARRRAVPAAVYCRPEVAAVGCSPAELAALPAVGRRRHRVDLAELDRGRTDGIEHGVAVVDVERFTGRILAASVVGPAAAEIIGIFTLAIDEGVGLRSMFGMVHPYPAHAQLVGRIADDFARDTFPVLPREWWAMVRGRMRRRMPRRTTG